MAASLDDRERVEPESRDALRRWLGGHHNTSPGIWLVLDKKVAGGAPRRVALSDAVEELLCFGWIDSLPRRLDATRFMVLATPRKPKSVWSQANRKRVEQLIARNLMRPPGMAKVVAAQADGSWSVLAESDRLEVPADLHRAFRGRASARRNFDRFPAGVRKSILAWISLAKTEPTRAARVAQTVERAANNERSGPAAASGRTAARKRA